MNDPGQFTTGSHGRFTWIVDCGRVSQAAFTGFDGLDS